MKKLFTILTLMAIGILLSMNLLAQSPEKLSYQSIIRNASNNVVANAAVGIKISILQGSPSGTAVYVETQTPTTNANGLVSIEIGGGTLVSGDFSAINWSTGIYFIKTETDPDGSTNYSITGTSQLLSVPYSLFAQKAGNGFSGNYNDLSNKPIYDGSETKIMAGTNTSVSGAGTTESPYVVNATGLTPGTSAGQIQYWNGSAWVTMAPGLNLPGNQAQTLCLCKGVPTWGPCPPDTATIATGTISAILANTATCTASITNDGGSTVTARGVCWSTSTGPTISNSKTTVGTGIGSFTNSITGLTAATTYYYRAYATNGAGTAYGAEGNFKTTDGIVKLTYSGSNVTSISTATISNWISTDGGSTITARGVCWSTSTGPTISSSKTTDGTGTGSFTSSITGLTINTKYYARTYATNSTGTYYSAEGSFTTLNGIFSITTGSATKITMTTASIGTITIPSDGGAAITTRGVCYSTSPNPTISLTTKVSSGTGYGNFGVDLTGLTKNTTYYVRAYATNSVGTIYGDEITFKTGDGIIVLTSNPASGVTAVSAVISGGVTTDGGATITGGGVSFGTSPGFYSTIITTSATVTWGVTATVASNLLPNTTYYYKPWATNSTGTYYGPEASFTTLSGVMSLTTDSITNITSTSATSGVIITNEGGASMSNRGLCWSTSPHPILDILSNNYTMYDKAMNLNYNWVSNLDGLTPGTTYYVRAWGFNGAYTLGYQYGNELSFTTLGPPMLTTTAASAITETTATSGGNITSDCGAAITARGVCWNIAGNPTIANSKTTDGTGTGTFTSSLTGLEAGTTYCLRAYATNSYGTSYGTQVTFKTPKTTYTIGESYLGGKLAYVFQTGDPGYIAGEKHGIIASVKDTTTFWGFGLVTGAAGIVLGTGKQNTLDITSTYSSTNQYAARYCSTLVLNGYSGWYLPSVDELKKLYLNKTVLGMTGDVYWSSTQYSTNYAYYINFSTGLFDGTYSAYNYTNHYVRAIRYF